MYRSNLKLKLDELYESWFTLFVENHLPTDAVVQHSCIASHEISRPKCLTAIGTRSRDLGKQGTNDFSFWVGTNPVSTTRKAAEEKNLVERTLAGQLQGLGLSRFSKLLSLFAPFPGFLSSYVFKRLAGSADTLADAACRRFYQRCFANDMDEKRRFFNVIRQEECLSITFEDLVGLVEEFARAHPLLGFLRSEEFTEYRRVYAQTVAARVFYKINRSRRGTISWKEFNRSNIVETLVMVDTIEDLNDERLDYFSYEHFYVIYCKFTQMDTNHDGYIEKEDLLRYADDSLSERIVERIWEKKGCGVVAQREAVGMNYVEFVWFLMSEEDKTNDASIEYWFRCLDLDEDGYLSAYELEYFWEEQEQEYGIPFEYIYMQLLDIVRPRDSMRITQADIKATKMAPLVFDTLFNRRKFFNYEQEPYFAAKSDDVKTSDWHSFCKAEYDSYCGTAGAS